MFHSHGTHTKGKDMHTSEDTATYWQTMARLTGHSVRYLRVRALLRVALPMGVLSSLFAFALTK